MLDGTVLRESGRYVNWKKGVSYETYFIYFARIQRREKHSVDL